MLNNNRDHSIPTPIEVRVSLFAPIANTNIKIETKKNNKIVKSPFMLLMKILKSLQKKIINLFKNFILT